LPGRRALGGLRKRRVTRGGGSNPRTALGKGQLGLRQGNPLL